MFTYRVQVTSVSTVIESFYLEVPASRQRCEKITSHLALKKSVLTAADYNMFITVITNKAFSHSGRRLSIGSTSLMIPVASSSVVLKTYSTALLSATSYPLSPAPLTSKSS